MVVWKDVLEGLLSRSATCIWGPAVGACPLTLIKDIASIFNSKKMQKALPFGLFQSISLPGWHSDALLRNSYLRFIHSNYLNLMCWNMLQNEEADQQIL